MGKFQKLFASFSHSRRQSFVSFVCAGWPAFFVLTAAVGNNLGTGTSAGYCTTVEASGATTALTRTNGAGATNELCAVDEICQLSITRDTSVTGEIIHLKTGCVHKTVSTSR